MRRKKGILLPIVLLGLSGCGRWYDSQGRDATPTEPRHRVIVSTDIGGTDSDDLQSMVHLRDFAVRMDRCQSPREPEERVDLADRSSYNSSSGFSGHRVER